MSKPRAAIVERHNVIQSKLKLGVEAGQSSISATKA
jgi:hypothetical protein